VCGGRFERNARGGLDDVEQRHGFSVLWCLIALAVASLLTAAVIVGLPMAVPVFDFEGSAGMLLSIVVWFVSGMLVGLIAPGHTVSETLVATVLVAAPTAFSLFNGQTVKVLPAFMYVLLSALGVLFASIGSHLGERIQIGPSPAQPE
jgi:hypothetical protein